MVKDGRRGRTRHVGLAHPEMAGADGLVADRLQPSHADGLPGLSDKPGRRDATQPLMERVDAGRQHDAARGADEPVRVVIMRSTHRYALPMTSWSRAQIG